MKKVLPLLLVFVVLSLTSMIILPVKTQAYATETILEQAFDGETTGSIPEEWVVAYPQFGSFTVDDSLYYGGGGKSGKFVDSSSIVGGWPFVYRTFPQQSGKIIVEFVMMSTGSDSPNTGASFFVDNGAPSPNWTIPPQEWPLWNGVNIDFIYGDIRYYEGGPPPYGIWHTLQSYSANVWYEVKIIVDIPTNTYDIYIDSVLKAQAACFRSDTGETITQLSRMHFGATSDLTPIAHIDNIRITKLVPVIPATMDVNPNTLNLKSKGNWITCYIELPEGYEVNDIDVSSILLNDTIPIDPSAPIAIGDYDNDTIPDLMVKFDRAEVIEYILDHVPTTQKFMNIELTVTGYLNDGTQFQGTDTIKIISNSKHEILPS